MGPRELEREAIDVIVVFARGTIRPLRFRWQTRSYAVKTVHLVHERREGRECLRFFSVTDVMGNPFRLVFLPLKGSWFIEQVPLL
jgi:hypothetical protein